MFLVAGSYRQPQTYVWTLDIMATVSAPRLAMSLLYPL
jgi:hypothetical protein